MNWYYVITLLEIKEQVYLDISRRIYKSMHIQQC